MLSNAQFSALGNALMLNSVVITGVPGSGKTLLGALTAVASAERQMDRVLIVAKSPASLQRMLHTLSKAAKYGYFAF